MQAGAEQALYLPDAYAARTMEIGHEWTVLNLGVRFRQARALAWANPATLSGLVGFGLCHGTEQPYGEVEPKHFVGLKSAGSWARLSGRNWWQTGWNIFTCLAGEDLSHGSGSDGTLRVSETEDEQATAWYLRFTKDGGTIRVEAFLPTGLNSPTEFDFLMQLDREKWNRSVNNHESYREFALEADFDEDLFGRLDSVNVFSTLPHFVSNQLRSIEWLSVRAVRIE